MKDFNKPWFKIDDRDAERTFEQQTLGLGPLLESVKGKSILDIGCAEGLISMWLVKEGGARLVHGVEVVVERVQIANALARQHGMPAQYYTNEAENFIAPETTYDVVLLLAILHKLRNPTQVAAQYAEMCSDLAVVRLPPLHAPMIIDPRSNNNPHDINAVFTRRGFVLECVTEGAYGEWCGYYRRKTYASNY